MPLDISKIRGRVEAKLRAFGERGEGVGGACLGSTPGGRL